MSVDSFGYGTEFVLFALFIILIIIGAEIIDGILRWLLI